MSTRYLLPLVATLTVSLPASVKAATFHCAAEDVPCLIAAMVAANTNGEPGNIIRLAPGTYTLTAVHNTTQGPNGLPVVTSTLTIRADVDGSDVRIVRPATAPQFRFLYAASGARLTLDGITLTGGNVSGPPAFVGGALYSAGAEVTLAHVTAVGNRAGSAGAIYSDNGNLTLADTRVNDNTAGASAAAMRTVGGAVTVVRSEFARNVGNGMAAVDVSAPQTLRMEDTLYANNNVSFFGSGLTVQGGSAVLLRMTFARNSAEDTSALTIRDATVVVRDSTFVENLTGVDGRTVNIVGTSQVDIVNSTFAGNRDLSCCLASVIFNAPQATTTVVNSTFAGNQVARAFVGSNVNVQNTIVQDDMAPPAAFCPSQTPSRGHNIFDGAGATCGVSLDMTDLIAAAGLGAFTDTGVPGGGHLPLLAESLAIDAAEPGVCQATDQLGQPRSGPCDIGAVEFQAVGGGPTVSASPATVAPGTAVTVSWSGIAAPTANDWIALYAPGASDQEFLAWSYVSCTGAPGAPAASGSCPLAVPSALPSGTYELRLFSNGGSGVYTRLAISNSFTVGTGGGGGPLVNASPGTVSPGAIVMASWNGVGAPTANDWIALYVPGSNDQEFLAWIYVSCTNTPGAPAASGSCPLGVPAGLPGGTYELRLFSNGGSGVYTRLAVSNSFTVGIGGGGPTVSASPATAAPGEAITVSWSGISAPTANDWMALYVPGTVDQEFLTWIYVSCSNTPEQATVSGSCPLVLPSTLPAGLYEIRLFSNGGAGVYTRLATSNPIEVQ